MSGPTFPVDLPIFVAGARGMVGSAIKRLLKTMGFNNILAPDRETLDLSDQTAVNSFFAQHRPALVFLAAARVGGIIANNTFPAEFIRDNLIVQSNVIDAAQKFGAQRLLFLGSSCVYPKHASQPISECELLSGPLEPTNRPYAVAKIAGIEMCWSYNRQYSNNAGSGTVAVREPQSGTTYLAVMPTNLYGTGDNYHPTNSHVIPGLLNRFHEAKECAASEVVVWGSGSPRREFMHVDDMAQACIELALLPNHIWSELTASDRNDGEPPIVNIGVGEDISIAELAKLIALTVGFEGTIRFDTTKPDGTPRKLLAIEKLNRLVKIKPRSLDVGLAQVYKEYKNIAHTR